MKLPESYPNRINNTLLNRVIYIQSNGEYPIKWSVSNPMVNDECKESPIKLMYFVGEYIEYAKYYCTQQLCIALIILSCLIQ